MLECIAGWTSDNNPPLAESVVKDLVKSAVSAYAGNDADFLDLKNMALGTDPLAKAKIVKGMHQDQGNAFIVERHVTVELPWFPHAKRYHIYYWKDGKKGWSPVAISHEESKGIFKKIDL